MFNHAIYTGAFAITKSKMDYQNKPSQASASPLLPHLSSGSLIIAQFLLGCFCCRMLGLGDILRELVLVNKRLVLNCVGEIFANSVSNFLSLILGTLRKRVFAN